MKQDIFYQEAIQHFLLFIGYYTFYKHGFIEADDYRNKKSEFLKQFEFDSEFLNDIKRIINNENIH